MTHEAAYVTRSQLIDFAAARGISAAKVHRWINWGLLPKLELKSFGYGASTEARFPAAITEARLLEISQELREKRDLAALQWRLWWQGTDVATERIQRSLMRTVEKAATEKKAAMARQDGGEAWVRFDQKHRRLVTDESPLAGLQERLGKHRFVQLQKCLHEMTTGTLDSREADKTASVLRELLGPTVSNVAFEMAQISELFDPTDWKSALIGTSHEDLLKAREELQTLVAQLAIVGANNPDVQFGGVPLGLVALTLSLIPTDLWRDFFLAWLSWRRHAGFRVLFHLVMQIFQLPVSEWSTTASRAEAAGLL